MSVRPTHQAICSVFTPWHQNPSLSWVTPQNSNPNGPLCYEKNIAFLYFSYLHSKILERAAEIKAGDRETYSKREREMSLTPCPCGFVPAMLCSTGLTGPKAVPTIRVRARTHGHTRAHTLAHCVWPVSHGSTCQLLTTSLDTPRERKWMRGKSGLLQTQQAKQMTDLAVQMGPVLFDAYNASLATIPNGEGLLFHSFFCLRRSQFPVNDEALHKQVTVTHKTLL